MSERVAQPGDWVEARGVHGEPGRRGQIVEVIGQAGHRRYRVRWDEEHESILYLADGVILSPAAGRGSAPSATGG